MHQLINLFLVLQLYPRENELKNIFLLFILVCLCFVGLSRLMSPNLFRIIFRDFFSKKTYVDSYTDLDTLSPASHIFLFLNLFITTVVCLVSIIEYTISVEEMIYQCFALACSFFLIQQLGFRIIGSIISEPLFSKNLSMITRQTWNFIGLVMFVLATLILLNEEYKPVIKILVYSMLFLLPFTKIIKGVIYAKSNNYGGLYIILYLCTLEILPLLVLGHYFRELF